MMKYIVLLVVLSPIVSTSMLSQNRPADSSVVKRSEPTIQSRRHNLPSEITMLIEVETSPGITDPGSFWEGAYEISVADWREITKERNLNDRIKIGDLMVQVSSPRLSLQESDHRSFKISVRVDNILLQRLQNQEKNPQGFLLRSTIRLFDAQLDQNYTFQVNRVWQFRLFPDGQASISIKINPDGSYSTWGPIPKHLPETHSIKGFSADAASPRRP